MKRLITVLLLILSFYSLITASEISVLPYELGEGFPIVGSDGKLAVFVVDSKDAEVVTTAAEAVIGDINLITGDNLQLVNSLEGVNYPIIAGTIGESAFIDKLAEKGLIDISNIADKWEAYGLEVVDNPEEGIGKALVLYGSTPRGTAYALFELSRLMGVSPYVWWADVIPEKREALYVTPGKMLVDEPSVKFRGIFINDEDWGLMPWAAKNLDSEYNNIGPNTYAKVMELLLRLRANVLWPAMHPCSQAFWDNKENLPIARKYDIALGSSHCEQMLRNNVWEWERYADHSGTNDNWNYVTNKDMVQRYWEDRVVESKGISAMYTLGMRGVHDSGFSGYPTPEDKVRGLTEIIEFQRSLIEKHLGDPTTIPQIFIPYKEVLEAYNYGLQVPEDVILTWVDDNHGYIRQLPTKSEQSRSGGHGVYYHISYWGSPADYLWICSTSPSLISYELVKGYENGIKDLWVINVGDIKPAEAELEFCMDLAWDIDKWQPQQAHKYNRYWAAKTFGEEVADALADIKMEYYELAAAGKPEHIFAVNFNSKEMDERIGRYAALASKVDKVSAQIPPRLKDAFFELVEYPVKGAYYMNLKTFRARQSMDLAAVGKGEMALNYAEQAKDAYRMIGEMTEKYNKEIAGGKWDGIMDYKPRSQKQFDMPPVADSASIYSEENELEIPKFAVVKADEFSEAYGSFKTLKNLGISGVGITVLPLNMYSYTEVTDAPYVEYRVPVKAGLNSIEARFLPTFPIHDGDSMNVAVTVNGGDPVTASLKTKATEGKWKTTVLQGFNDASVTFLAEEDGVVPVRVSMLDPGIVLNEIYVTFPKTKD